MHLEILVATIVETQADKARETDASRIARQLVRARRAQAWEARSTRLSDYLGRLARLRVARLAR